MSLFLCPRWRNKIYLLIDWFKPFIICFGIFTKTAFALYYMFRKQPILTKTAFALYYLFRTAADILIKYQFKPHHRKFIGLGFEPRARFLLLTQKPVLYHGWSGVVETHALYHSLGEKLKSPSVAGCKEYRKVDSTARWRKIVTSSSMLRGSEAEHSQEN